MNMELHWSARDLVLVFQCRRVPYLRALSPMLRVQWRCSLPNTTQSLRLRVRQFSMDFFLGDSNIIPGFCLP